MLNVSVFVFKVPQTAKKKHVLPRVCRHGDGGSFGNDGR